MNINPPEFVRGRLDPSHSFRPFKPFTGSWHIQPAPGGIQVEKLATQALSRPDLGWLSAPGPDAIEQALEVANGAAPVKLSDTMFPGRTGWVLLPYRVALLAGVENYSEVLMPAAVQILRWLWTADNQLIIWLGDGADGVMVAEGWQPLLNSSGVVSCRAGAARLLAAIMAGDQ